MDKRELLDRFAASGEERMSLARLLDKCEQAQRRNIPTCSQFLTPGERAVAEGMLRGCGARFYFFGGFSGAERCVCAFPADWQEGEDLFSADDGPLAAVEGTFHADAALSHRDILGALMGLGIERALLGDILLDGTRCQIVTLRQALPILLTQWESAGRWKVSAREIPLTALSAAPPEVKVIRDTVASPRLDAIVASAFSLSRGKAGELISSGQVQLNHRPCQKGDRLVAQGDVLSCRGFGKCAVTKLGGQSRKGRLLIELARYI